MASLSKDRNGNYTIQFVATNGKRPSIRLGKVPKKTAESILLRVEHLVAAAASGMPLDADTAAWVASLGDQLAGRLARVGLIPERPKPLTLGELVELQGEETGGETKHRTRASRRVMLADLLAFFTPAADPRAITEADARKFLEHLKGRGLASLTVAVRLRRVRGLFAFAVMKKLLPDNPFAGVKASGVMPADRQVYVTADDARRVIAVANPTWRTIIALCRFGGLRCPSEVLTLRWEHVDFPGNRMTVTSPKTDRIPGKEYRVCKIFAELRPYLEEAWELAEPGAEFVVSGPQWDVYRARSRRAEGGNSTMRSAFLRLVRRAGLVAWPKPFHTLRASCETDLLEQGYPFSAVTAWLGHSAAVALKHYTRIPDRLYDQAAPLQSAVQHPPAPERTGLNGPAAPVREEAAFQASAAGCDRVRAPNPVLLELAVPRVGHHPELVGGRVPLVGEPVRRPGPPRLGGQQPAAGVGLQPAVPGEFDRQVHEPEQSPAATGDTAGFGRLPPRVVQQQHRRPRRGQPVQGGQAFQHGGRLGLAAAGQEGGERVHDEQVEFAEDAGGERLVDQVRPLVRGGPAAERAGE